MIDVNDIDNHTGDRDRWIFEQAYLLNHVWGVTDTEAWKAATSANNALMTFIGAGVPGVSSKVSARSAADFFIEANIDTPEKAIEIISRTKWIADQIYYPDIPSFYEHLADILKRKKRKFTPDQVKLDWKTAAILLWTEGEKGIPPRCLWSDSALLELPPGGAVSENAVRKEISRLKLYRPKSPCYGYELGPKGSFRFAPRSRGAVTKKV